jgi:hypothetical protein
MACKYLTIFLSLLILKFFLLKLTHSQIMIGKQLDKNGYQNANVWNVREVKHIYEVPLETLSRLHLGWNACSPPAGLAVCVFPPLALNMLKPARNVCVGPSPLWFPQRFIVRREYQNLKWFHSYVFKNVSPKQNFIQIFKFLKIGGSSSATIMDEAPWKEEQC